MPVVLSKYFYDVSVYVKSLTYHTGNLKHAIGDKVIYVPMYWLCHVYKYAGELMSLMCELIEFLTAVTDIPAKNLKLLSTEVDVTSTIVDGALEDEKLKRNTKIVERFETIKKEIKAICTIISAK